MDNYDIFVSEDDAQTLIDNVVKFHKTMGRKARGARKGTSPIIKDHEFLNFKGVKKIAFPTTGYPFKFGDINDIFGRMNSMEGLSLIHI